MVKFFFCLFSLLVCACATALGQNVNITNRAIYIKTLLSRADTIPVFGNDFTNADTIAMLNRQISTELGILLSSPDIINYDLDTLLKHEALVITHSLDKRLWFLSWYENTGGSWKSFVNVIHYRTQKQRPGVVLLPLSIENSDESAANFCLQSAPVSSIYKLRNKADIYLCMASGVSCNTCCYESAATVRLTVDSIILGEPLIDTNGDTLFNGCYTLDSRCGSVEKFKFDPVKQVLNITYTTDDILTREDTDETNTPKKYTEIIKL